MEDDVDELTDSYFSKAAARVFDKIYTRKDDILPLSKSVDFIATLGKSYHSEEMAGHTRKLDPH